MDLEKAKMRLKEENLTCVLCKAEQVITSTQRGVRPLLNLLDSGTDVAGFSVADRVVGKASAMLYCLLGVYQVYALVMSRPALEILRAHGIEVSFETLVEGIRNRTNDGPCPMEQATRDLQDPAQAPQALKAALAALQKT